jgi:hypothetical protein
VIIYFIINGVIAKNNLFNHHILEQEKGEEIQRKGTKEKPARGKKRGGRLKVVK